MYECAKLALENDIAAYKRARERIFKETMGARKLYKWKNSNYGKQRRINSAIKPGITHGLRLYLNDDCYPRADKYSRRIYMYSVHIYIREPFIFYT